MGCRVSLKLAPSARSPCPLACARRLVPVHQRLRSDRKYEEEYADEDEEPKAKAIKAKDKAEPKAKAECKAMAEPKAKAEPKG
eukprot:12884165-Prorocentrum_lima.AAC.1